MVEDFTTFRQIEATEYVDDLFELRSGYGTPSLSLFCELVNREMMWTISEIVSEPNATKRMRVIKQFIKIARQVWPLNTVFENKKPSLFFNEHTNKISVGLS